MTRRRGLQLLVLSIIAIVCAVALLASVAAPEPVAAQDGEPVSPALTSAEPSPGSRATLLSPPDTTVPTLSDAAAAPQAFISWRVTGSAMRPRENDVSNGVSASGGCTYVTSGDAFTVWNTPVHLPQGSTVGTLRMFYYDASASNTSGWFTIYDLYGSIVQEWSVTSSGNAGNGFNDSAQINHIIDYNTYSYLINWRPVVSGSSMQLCGFRVFYEPPPFGASFLPRIIR